MAKKKVTYKMKSVPAVRKGYRRGTYYLTDRMIKALKHRAIEDGTDASAVVRDALARHLGLGTAD